MTNLGVQGFTIREHMADRNEFDQTLAKIAEIGYNGLQLRVPAYLTTKEYADMLEAHGIKGLTMGATVDEMLKDPSAAIEGAHMLGAELLFLASIPKDLRYSEAGYHTFAANMNKCGQIAKKEGLRVTYHAHAFEFCTFDGYNGMDILLGETDADCVEMMPDTHWLACAGINPADFIRRVANRCTQVHFKDYKIAIGEEVLESVPRRFAEVGRGNLDWPSILRAVRESGIDIVVVEQDVCEIDPFTSLKISFDAMKRMGL